MFDRLDFLGGTLLGTFLGSLATLIYHIRQIRHEARQNYVRLSLAHSELTALERTLKIERRSSFQVLSPLEVLPKPEPESNGAAPSIPAWQDNPESPPDGTASDRSAHPAGGT